MVRESGPSLLGRNWLTALQLDWGSLLTVRGHTLTQVLSSRAVVFAEGLGELKGHQAKIHIDPGAQPRFCKARPVPYAMRTLVEEELERLQSKGIIEPVEFADWAAQEILASLWRLQVDCKSSLLTGPVPNPED